MRRSTASLAARASFALALGPILALGSGCSDDSEGTTSGTTDTAGVGGGTGGSGGSGGSGGTGGFEMAAHHPFPTLTGEVSAVIAHAKLVTITFQGNQRVAEIEAAGDALVKSEWLLAVGADYGVGAGEHLAKVHLPEAAPAALDDPGLGDLLDQHIAGGLLPPPSADVLYMIHISPETVFDDGDGFLLCDDYLGYHYQHTGPNGTLTYGIIGDCETGIEELTATFAHEYIEASTDPGESGGFYLQLAKTSPWFALDGLENADLCDDAPYVMEAGFTYQRSWSNVAAAAALGSPCAPIVASDPFFDVSAEPDAIAAVAAGETATFTLTGWSNAPVADWELAHDASYYSEFEPTVEFSAKTINNGKTVTVTLGVPAGTKAGLLGTAMIYSGDGYGRFWPVTVRSK